PVGDAVFLDICAFAESFFRYYEYGTGFILLINTNHTNYFIFLIIYLNTPYADGAAAGITHGIFRETDGASAADSHHDLAVTVGELRFQQLVAFVHGDGVHTVLTGTAEFFEQCFLDNAVAGAEHDVMTVDEILVVQVLDVDDRADLVVRRDRDQVLDGAALALLLSFRYFVDLQPVAAA